MYTKILVPLDETPSAEVALPHAAAIARQFGAELVLLSVVVAAMSEDAVMELTIEKQVAREDQSYLAGKAGVLTRQGLKVSTRVVEGRVADAILSAAADGGADMIVMATHGHGGLRHLLLGGTAEEVVRHSTVPVMLVRSA